MRSLKRRAAIAAVTTVCAGSAAAIALAAAGPGTPESHEYGGGLFAGLVNGTARFCEGTDGGYAELTTHYQTFGLNGSSDPRFNGPADVYLHYLIRDDGVGHVDGNIVYFDAETGKRTANARAVATTQPSEEQGDSDFGSDLTGLGFLGGSRGTTDGSASASGDLPRGVIYTPITFASIIEEVFVAYGINEGPEPLPTSSEETGGLVQSFNCANRYQPIDFGGPSGVSPQNVTASGMTFRPQPRIGKEAATAGLATALQRSGASADQAQAFVRFMEGSLR